MKGPPNVPYIRIEPNAFAGMQSKAIGIRVAYWDANKETIYYRKTFEIAP